MMRKTCLIFGLISISNIILQAQTFQSFDSTKIAYNDEGHGEPIILIHGFINTSKNWDKSILKNELLAKGYRVIVPDLRGNGDSERPQNEEAYANDAEIKDIISLANHLKFKFYCIVGYSRGSIVAAKLITADNRIKKCVIGGMGIDFTNPNWDRRIMFMNAFLGIEPLNSQTEGAVNYAKSQKADLKVLGYTQKYQPVATLEELAKVKIPILVVCGDEDQDNGDPKKLANAFKKGQLQIVKGIHNDVYKQADFAKAILSFLK